MRLLPLQSAKAVNSRKAGFLLATTSRRALSGSCICLEEVKPVTEPEPEPQKGVPLAFNLSGISISKPVQRLTLAQRLAARHAEQAKAAASASSDASSEKTLQAKDNNSTTSPRQGTRSQGHAASASRRTQEERGGSGRPPFQNGQRNTSQGGQRNIFQNGQRQPFQAGQRAGGYRPAGRGQGQGGSANAASRKKGAARSKKGAAPNNADASMREADPELNDYPSEGSNKPPPRKYDDEGLLKLKGVHSQLNPTVRPILPKFATQPTPSTSAFSAAKKAPVTGTLRILSYLERAAPKPAAEPTHNVLGVIDNADLALSRVRDLEVRHRRDALDIVQKMASPTSGTGRKPAVRA